MTDCYNCLVELPDDDYHLGYFEGIRMVVLKLGGKPMPADFRSWLNEELKEALRLRDES